MSNNWFKVEFAITLPGFWLWMSTPDFTTTNHDHYPSLIPKWELRDFNKEPYQTERRYMLFFTWVFHLTAAWGIQTPAKS